jgi:hypothetical protein
MTMAGAILCVLRARFFRFEVRRFGTAMNQFLIWCDELVWVALMLEQRAPARISRGWCAAASAFVQVGAASRAEPFAIISALDVQGRRE